MKNTEKLAEQSRRRVTPLYYSAAEDAVYSEPGDRRWFLTELIRYNTPEEIERTVRRFMAM